MININSQLNDVHLFGSLGVSLLATKEAFRRMKCETSGNQKLRGFLSDRTSKYQNQGDSSILSLACCCCVCLFRRPGSGYGFPSDFLDRRIVPLGIAPQTGPRRSGLTKPAKTSRSHAKRPDEVQKQVLSGSVRTARNARKTHARPQILHQARHLNLLSVRRNPHKQKTTH